MDTPALPHYQYRTPNGEIVRLVNDDLIVRMDPLRETTRGGIIIPDTAGDRGDAGILTTGTVEAFGFATIGGKKNIPFQRIPLPEFYIGMKVVFIRYYAEQHTNKSIQHTFGEGVIKLKPLDVMLAFDPEDMDRVLR